MHPLPFKPMLKKRWAHSDKAPVAPLAPLHSSQCGRCTRQPLVVQVGRGHRYGKGLLASQKRCSTPLTSKPARPYLTGRPLEDNFSTAVIDVERGRYTTVAPFIKVGARKPTHSAVATLASPTMSGRPRNAAEDPARSLVLRRATGAAANGRIAGSLVAGRVLKLRTTMLYLRNQLGHCTAARRLNQGGLLAEIVVDVLTAFATGSSRFLLPGES